MSTLVGLGILIIAVVYLAVGLIKMLFMFSATIPSFLACLFSKESRDEIKSIEWDSDTILGFVCLFALGGLAILFSVLLYQESCCSHTRLPQ